MFFDKIVINNYFIELVENVLFNRSIDIFKLILLWERKIMQIRKLIITPFKRAKLRAGHQLINKFVRYEKP